MYDRFWSYVNRAGDDDCWEWLGAKKPTGYGVFKFNYQQHRAHRFAYRLKCGKLPPDAHVLHRCDNPGCVNPNHLFLGDHNDNMRDMAQKKRSVHGERNPRAKLTSEDVSRIRKLYAMGSNATQISKDYFVCTSTIRRIVTGKTWA